MLIDSNIIIYASLPEYSWLNEQLEQGQPLVSVVSYVEVLGFHKLHEAEKEFFEQFFDLASLLPIDHKTLQEAVRLRQMRKMALGDSLIAATAVVHGLPLMTRNEQDFSWIAGLVVINPFASLANGGNGEGAG